MILKNDPIELLSHQLDSFYGFSLDNIIVDKVYGYVLERLDNCFTHINNKYYSYNGKAFFNPLHVAQWTMFLYFMANELHKQKVEDDLCDMIYGISKCYSSADIFYCVEMPDIWFCDHSQGSVIGRAMYSNYFSFSQGCTVGNNKGKYPVFGEHVSMLSNSKFLGDCSIGNYVIFSANSYVIDMDIPSLSIVFGTSPNIIIKPITKIKYEEITGQMFKIAE